MLQHRRASQHGQTSPSMLRGAVVAVAMFGLAGTAFAGAGRTIEETESWRVAAFWLVFIILSMMVEKMFHYSEHSLHGAGKKGCAHFSPRSHRGRHATRRCR